MTQKKLPKIYHFKTEKAKEPYIIKTDCIADGFTASLSELYHQMNEENTILKEGDHYTSTESPWGYFRYKGQVWPVYNDDPGQCDYIYVNGEACSAGTYNFDPIGEFISIIDYYNKEEK